MIGVIVVMIVCITIGVIANIKMNRELKKISQLEDRLDEYYKRRENKLIKRFRDVDQ